MTKIRLKWFLIKPATGTLNKEHDIEQIKSTTLGKFISGIFNHAFFAIGIALGVGVLAMVGLVQVYSYFWEEEDRVAEIENPVERALSGDQAEGPIQTLHIKRVPGPFLSVGDNSVIGFVFLDVAMDISGVEQYATADANLAVLVARFSESLKSSGVGRTDMPGEVDYERLAKTFLALARDEVDLRGITSVRVSEAEGE